MAKQMFTDNLALCRLALYKEITKFAVSFVHMQIKFQFSPREHYKTTNFSRQLAFRNKFRNFFRKYECSFEARHLVTCNYFDNDFSSQNSTIWFRVDIISILTL